MTSAILRRQFPATEDLILHAQLGDGHGCAQGVAQFARRDLQDGLDARRALDLLVDDVQHGLAFSLFLRLGKGAGVLQGGGNLRRKRGLDVGVFLGEGIDAVRLHIQHAEHLVTDDQRHSQFGSGVRQHRVGKPARLVTYIVVHDDCLPGAGGAGHQRLFLIQRDGDGFEGAFVFIAFFPAAGGDLQVHGVASLKMKTWA
ncbi:MAG: hypothetical protein MZV64_60225 [Ignavibacteriales bacterium]|nr:hypothetical protein [Ignavibacteriales bacterium]